MAFRVPLFRVQKKSLSKMHKNFDEKDTELDTYQHTETRKLKFEDIDT